MTVASVTPPHGSDADAIAAREAGILGQPQRITPLRIEEVGPDAWRAVNQVREAIGLGPASDLPGYSLVLLKHPEIFRRKLEMGAAILSGALPAREREIAVLRIGWLLRAPYEWGEHVDIAQRFGMTKEEIERVTAGSDAPGWTEHESAILAAVEEMLATQTVSDTTWATLAKTWNEQQLLEFPMMVGQYVCTAIVQNTLRIRLEANNPGLSHR